MEGDDEKDDPFRERLWPAEFGHLGNLLGGLVARMQRQTSGWIFIMACLRVRCGSSVYVQKKSCSLTSNRGVISTASVSGDFCRRGDLLTGVDVEVVMVDTVAGILINCMPAPHWILSTVDVVDGRGAIWGGACLL